VPVGFTAPTSPSVTQGATHQPQRGPCLRPVPGRRQGAVRRGLARSGRAEPGAPQAGTDRRVKAVVGRGRAVRAAVSPNILPTALCSTGRNTAQCGTARTTADQGLLPFCLVGRGALFRLTVSNPLARGAETAHHPRPIGSVTHPVGPGAAATPASDVGIHPRNHRLTPAVSTGCNSGH